MAEEENKDTIDSGRDDRSEPDTPDEVIETPDSADEVIKTPEPDTPDEVIETPDSADEVIETPEPDTPDEVIKTLDSEDEVIETPDSADEVKIVDEKFRPKIKPVLDAKTMDLIEKKKMRKIPDFKRQEWFRYKRLGESWRRPKGLHSKLRRNMKYRPPRARVGYRTPSEVRGLHPSGFKDILVHNLSDLENIDPEKEAVRIGKTVGRRKRLYIIEKADGMNIRVLNRRGL